MSPRSLDVPPPLPRDATNRASRRSTSTRIGRLGETLARDFLFASGHEILATNARLGHDELDIVSLERTGTLVFSEVRSFHTRGTSHPTGLATLNTAKLGRLARAAARWRVRHPEHAHRRCRFDALAVELSAPARVSHVRGLAMPSAETRSFPSGFES